MGKTIVLYRSEYGYTKTYAEMIAKELGCDIREASGLSAGSLMEYDTVIFGGGLYASGINGIDFIKQNFDALQKKNLVVWATGLCPGRPSELQQVWKYNFTDDMLKKIHTFYLRGGFDYQKLSRAHKIMMNALKLKIKMTRNRSEDEEGVLKVSGGELRETQTANYFSGIYPIDCAVPSANAQSCLKCRTLLSVLLSA